MNTLLFAGLAGVLASASGTAIAASDSAPSGIVADKPVDIGFASPGALTAPAEGARAGGSRMGGHKMGGVRRMGGGHRMRTRHRGAGSHVRRGRMGYGKGYRRPHRGFRLPRTFIQPSFFIGNFGRYGLSQPTRGYGWSRYYDDAVLTDRRGVVHDTRYNVDWDRYNQGYNDGYQAGQARYDQSVFLSDDRVVSTATHGHGGPRHRQEGGGSTYQGDWNGAYQQDGSYQGDWQGTYQGSDGRVYEGQYSGTFVGDTNVAPAGASYADGGTHWENRGPGPRYDDRGQGDDLAYLERCKKSSGIGGAIVGGAIGALAGNRIAGRGNRLGGSLIGGGLGALAGGAIDRGSDRCRKLLKKYHEPRDYSRSATRGHGQVQHRAPVQRRAPVQSHRYSQGWQGYYQQPAYYYPQPQVTTVVIQSQPVTTTTTTTTIEEDVYYTKARTKPVYKKRWKPAPKRKWKPRAKPAPVLKGCQQERCYYD